jgi:hypothetical protein
MGITHIRKHRQTHTHTHTHTHGHRHTPVWGPWGEISAISEITGLTKCADTFMSQKNHPTYTNTWSVIISNFVLGRKVDYHLEANDVISTNSPECMHQAISVIEIICSKPMMHTDTWLEIFEHTLDIFNECCTFPHLTGVHSWFLD